MEATIMGYMGLYWDNGKENGNPEKSLNLGIAGDSF